MYRTDTSIWSFHPFILNHNLAFFVIAHFYTCSSGSRPVTVVWVEQSGQTRCVRLPMRVQLDQVLSLAIAIAAHVTRAYTWCVSFWGDFDPAIAVWIPYPAWIWGENDIFVPKTFNFLTLMCVKIDGKLMLYSHEDICVLPLTLWHGTCIGGFACFCPALI